VLGQKAKEEAGKKKSYPTHRQAKKGAVGGFFLGGGAWVAPLGCVAMWA